MKLHRPLALTHTVRSPYCVAPQVPAVTELIIAELLYLNYESKDKVSDPRRQPFCNL